MEYTKPELNVIGAAEGLVLGPNAGHGETTGNSKASSAFEFEE
jgi:hypothetical protein